MFREILEIFRRHTTLDEIENEFDQMLEIAKVMFQNATAPIAGEDAEPDIRSFIKEHDMKINRIEQGIRRKIYTHLVVSGTADLAPALAFMNIVKDAERLGDFVKNIYEVIHRSRLQEEPQLEKILRLRRHILLQFDNIREVLKVHDDLRAKQIVELSKKDQAECDGYIFSLVEGSNELIECKNPVACALIFRFFKRVLSHLVNIATAVYMPIDKLDVFDESEG